MPAITAPISGGTRPCRPRYRLCAERASCICGHPRPRRRDRADSSAAHWDSERQAMPFELGGRASPISSIPASSSAACWPHGAPPANRSFSTRPSRSAATWPRPRRRRGFPPHPRASRKAAARRDPLALVAVAGLLPVEARWRGGPRASHRETRRFSMPTSACWMPRCGRYAAFLPGHPDRLKVMDRLHAFCYFLEGLLPRAREPRCCAAINDGLRALAALLPDRAGVRALRRVRAVAPDPRVCRASRRDAARPRCSRGRSCPLADLRSPGGGFYFGRQGGDWLPFLNPVSTVFAMQALAVWSGEPASIADLI